jgi:hypothetical protein
MHIVADGGSASNPRVQPHPSWRKETAGLAIAASLAVFVRLI